MENAFLWILIVAVFWIPPFFVASWLGAVKRTSAIERPVIWALGGWIGTLVFGLKQTYVASDPELAQQRSRIVVLMSLIGLCGVVALNVWGPAQ